jgi:hypothetical protein
MSGYRIEDPAIYERRKNGRHEVIVLQANGSSKRTRKEKPMATYRKKKGSDTWHWCRNCSKWPTSDYEETVTSTRPIIGELCNECKGKEKDGSCRQ